jgi:SnoaL-like polyketide cyclase
VRCRKGARETVNSVKIVEEFWKRVWKARNPAAIDDFVVDDFVITTGGVDIVSKAKFKEWASAFMAKINDLQFEVIETFQNEDGRRVASRWRITGKNNGMLDTPPDQQPISFTGTAVWAVREDGNLCHNWVERSSFELFQQLRDSRSAVDGL